MGTSRRLAILGLAVLSLYLFYTGGGVRRLRESVERIFRQSTDSFN